MGGGGDCADVGAVLGPAVGDAGRDEGVGFVGVNREVGGWINEVFAEDVAFFHESVEIVPRGVDCDPAGVVARVGAVDGTDEFDF